jgi:ADP-ribose pyrophosphatase YjhB (NUDIX family)
LAEYQNPKLAVDCIIRVDGKLAFIRRNNPPLGLALPGGFVDYGESVEDAVRREMREETGLELENLRQFHVYSEPKRDPRWHCVSVVFTADGVGRPIAGDDASSVVLADGDSVPFEELVFDHARVVKDYLASAGRILEDDQAG